MNLHLTAILALVGLPLLVNAQVGNPANPAFVPGSPVAVTAGTTSTGTTGPTLAASCKGLVALSTSDAASAPTIKLVRKTSVPLSMHDELTIEVRNPKPLVSCLADSRTEPVLFVDHMALPDLTPRAKIASTTVDEQTLLLVYRLERTSASSKQWGELLFRDWVADTRPRPLTLGIGAGPLFETAVLTDASAVQSQFGSGNRWWAVAALGVALVLLFAIGRKSNLIRDRAPKNATAPTSARAGTYSLARVVLSCWVLTTTAAILVVYGSSSAVPALDGGVPLLLLASGLTMGTGAVIEAIRGIGVGNSASFLEDILNDRDGLAVHRLQALVVNMLLLFVVWSELISAGTIANVERGWGVLMGISSGVYLYGKTTETVS